MDTGIRFSVVGGVVADYNHNNPFINHKGMPDGTYKVLRFDVMQMDEYEGYLEVKRDVTEKFIVGDIFTVAVPC